MDEGQRTHLLTSNKSDASSWNIQWALLLAAARPERPHKLREAHGALCWPGRAEQPRSRQRGVG